MVHVYVGMKTQRAQAWSLYRHFVSSPHLLLHACCDVSGRRRRVPPHGFLSVMT